MTIAAIVARILRTWDQLNADTDPHHLCGLDYATSCASCQVGFLRDPARWREIPTADLMRWLAVPGLTFGEDAAARVALGRRRA